MTSTTQAVSGANNRGRQQRRPSPAGAAGQTTTFPPPRGPGAVTGALARALRAALILTPQLDLDDRPPSQLRATNADLCNSYSDLCAVGTVAPFVAVPEALAAARAGDIMRADACELAWRNAWRILPRVPSAEFAEQLDRGRELMAFEIARNAGPRGETLIEWAWIRPCMRCWRRLSLRAKCYRCNGSGHRSEEWEPFYADLDGNVVEIANG